MVVPLSLDPGHRDPRSPLFQGCHTCGKHRARQSPCRDCQREQERGEALAKQYQQEALSHREVMLLEESDDLDAELQVGYHSERQMPEDRVEAEHRAERAYQKLMQEREN